MRGFIVMADKGTIIIEGSEELDKRIQALQTDSPGFEKRLREAIRKVLAEVRKALQKSAAPGLNMKSDPRKAYKAVRMAVYRRLLGGQVNILSSYNARPGLYYEPPRHPSKRGGNRMKQSPRTHDIMSYSGADRGFILRFLNDGTEARYTGGRNGRTASQRNRFIMRNNGRGYRGNIAPRNWFGPRSQQELEAASRNIQAMVDDIINGIFV